MENGSRSSFHQIWVAPAISLTEPFSILPSRLAGMLAETTARRTMGLKEKLYHSVGSSSVIIDAGTQFDFHLNLSAERAASLYVMYVSLVYSLAALCLSCF